jgi:hypothetical protein
VAEPVFPPQNAFRLPDEPEDTDDLEDARHWEGVYGELVVGARVMTRSESGTHRRARLIHQEKIEQRFAFWESRRRQLSAVSEAAG